MDYHALGMVPFKLDHRTQCPGCRKNPLRVPLEWNGTSPYTKLYWCVQCDEEDTAKRFNTSIPDVQDPSTPNE